jgi:hypothetical protein
MKRPHILAAGAGLLLLVSASPPPELDSVVAADSGSYPTCSATITDRCVQRYEGDSAARAAHKVAPVQRPRAVAARHAYPPCTATRTDSCTQIRGRAVRTAARHHRTARRQLAYLRAGERG